MLPWPCFLLLIATLIIEPGPGPGWTKTARAAGTIVSNAHGDPTLNAPPCASENQAIIRLLNRDAARSRVWATAFGVGFGIAAVAQLGAGLATSDRDARIDLLWSAGSAALGVVPTLIVPPGVIGDAAALDLRETCEALGRNRERLASARDHEAFETGALAHATSAAASVAVSLVLGLGYGHWASGAINLALGIPIGELMIWTQPTSALKGLRGEDGLEGANGPHPGLRRGSSINLLPWVSRAGAGAQLSGTF